MPSMVRKNLKAAKIAWNIIGIPDNLKEYYKKSGKTKPKEPLPYFFTQPPM